MSQFSAETAGHSEEPAMTDKPNFVLIPDDAEPPELAPVSGLDVALGLDGVSRVQPSPPSRVTSSHRATAPPEWPPGRTEPAAADPLEQTEAAGGGIDP